MAGEGGGREGAAPRSSARSSAAYAPRAPSPSTLAPGGGRARSSSTVAASSADARPRAAAAREGMWRSETASLRGGGRGLRGERGGVGLSAPAASPLDTHPSSTDLPNGLVSPPGLGGGRPPGELENSARRALPGGGPHPGAARRGGVETSSTSIEEERGGGAVVARANASRGAARRVRRQRRASGRRRSPRPRYRPLGGAPCVMGGRAAAGPRVNCLAPCAAAWRGATARPVPGCGSVQRPTPAGEWRAVCS